MEKIKYFILNFGPQHPAAHGVLRLIIILKGEFIIYADAHIGLLHRGSEKLIEYKTFLQGLPYFARFDYVSSISQEHVFCLIIEKFLDIEIKKKSSYIRMLFLELSRILNHLLAITTHALDVGAMTIFLWGFEEREHIMEFCERASGARMHTSYFRFGGIHQELPKNFLKDVLKFIEIFKIRIKEFEELLNLSRIWKQRLKNIGCVSLEQAFSYSFSGPLVRASGLYWDLRKLLDYENYDNLEFLVPTALNGDCYDRFIIRIEEMKISSELCNQIIDWLEWEGSYLADEDISLNDYRISPPKKKLIKKSMEALISHFKLYSEGFSIEEEELYCSAETPKGEFGIFLETESSNKPYRCKVRAPGFFHLQGLNFMSFNHLLADIVTIIGTQDIVFGEIDR